MNRQSSIVVALALLAGCGGKSPTSPSSVTPPASTTTTAATPTTTPAPTTTPTTPAPTATATSVRIDCSSSVTHGEKTKCRALAEVPGLTAGSLTIRKAATVDVSDRATWTSSNPAVAKVTNGEIEGLSVGTASIEAAFQGQTGRMTIEVKKNEMDFIAAAAGAYRAMGVLVNNTCQGGSPVMTFTGTIDVSQIGVMKRDVTVKEGTSQRVFTGTFAASGDSGNVTFTTDPLAFPFGPSSAVLSSRLTGTVNPSGATTTVQEEMTCSSGSIIFRIDTIKLF